LSDSAIEVAELEGCDVSLPLLLLVARTVADLCDLVEWTDACEMERSSSCGDVEASASILACPAEHVCVCVRARRDASISLCGRVVFGPCTRSTSGEQMSRCGI
jgi:hypothetical protein